MAPLPEPLWTAASPEMQAGICALVQSHEDRIAGLENRLSDLENRLELNSTNSSKVPSSQRLCQHPFILWEPEAEGARWGDGDGGQGLLMRDEGGLLRRRIRLEPTTGSLRVGMPERLPLPAVFSQFAQSRDGRVLASPKLDRALVWRADRPDRVLTLSDHKDARHVAVSPDGAWVVIGEFTPPSEAKVYDARSGSLRRVLPAGQGIRMEFSPDGRRLLTSSGSTSGQVHRWDTDTWAEVPFEEPVTGIFPAVSPDGKLLAVETSDGGACLHSAGTGKELARFEDPRQDRASQLLFTPDGSKLISSSGEGFCVRIWDLTAIRRYLSPLGLDWELK